MATLVVNDTTPKVQYTATSGQTVFTYPFAIFQDSDLAVYVGSTLKTLDTDYTATGSGTSSGGDVTFTTGLTAGDIVTIYRDLPVSRTSDYQTAGDLLAETLNDDLDRVVMMAQQNEQNFDLALKVNQFDTFTDMTLPVKATRSGTVLGFNATTGDPEAGPTIADVSSLAAITADIATLADIEDGTENTDAIQTVAGISSNVTTTAGISSDVTTVAGISTDVTAVAADATDIGTVSTNIASVNTVATNISDVVTVANDLNEAISEIETAANDLNETVSEIDTVSNSITNVDTVGTNIANVNTVAGNNANVTTVAGISGNVTTVAGISTDVTTVAGNNANVTTVAGNNANVTTVATDITNVNSVGTSIANVNTVAGSIADVNRYAAEYTIAATAPATPAEGDLWYDSTGNELKYYDGVAWATNSASAAATSAANAATSETNAATSETNAATSATNAATSETNAATSATNAATSATNAATSETNAASSASLADTDRTDAFNWANRAEDSGYTDSATNTGYSAFHYAEKADAHADRAASYFALVESSAYIVNTNSDFGAITDSGSAPFSSESGNTKYTMAKGSGSYDYGALV